MTLRTDGLDYTMHDEIGLTQSEWFRSSYIEVAYANEEQGSWK
jgi:hypothetical protein